MLYFNKMYVVLLNLTHKVFGLELGLRIVNYKTFVNKSLYEPFHIFLYFRLD